MVMVDQQQELENYVNDVNQKKFLPVGRLFPNVITLLGLCAGMSAIRFALNEKWEMAVTFVVIAAFLDAMDGRIARFLNATSDFGAHLDSLADFVSFGVVPPMVLYLWQLQTFPIKGLSWALVLFFAICGILRLARFNCMSIDEDPPEWANSYFVGIPITAGAILSLLPMMLYFQLQLDIFKNSFIIAAYMTFIAILMASRVPTFSSKRITVRKDMISLTMVVFGIIIVGIIIEPWVTLPIIGTIYLSSIPISVFSFSRKYLRH